MAIYSCTKSDILQLVVFNGSLVNGGKKKANNRQDMTCAILKCNAIVVFCHVLVSGNSVYCHNLFIVIYLESLFLKLICTKDSLKYLDSCVM